MTRSSLVLVLALVWAPSVSARPAPPSSTSPPLVEMEVAGVVPHDNGQTVLLVDKEDTLFIPIGVGGSEALSIHLRAEGKRFERPLTHDLLDAMLKDLDATVVRVEIGELRGGVFIATVFVKAKDRVLRFDARASDAIALALGAKAPIFVAESVRKEAGIRPADVMPGGEQPHPVPEPPQVDVFAL